MYCRYSDWRDRKGPKNTKAALGPILAAIPLEKNLHGIFVNGPISTVLWRPSSLFAGVCECDCQGISGAPVRVRSQLATQRARWSLRQRREHTGGAPQSMFGSRHRATPHCANQAKLVLGKSRFLVVCKVLRARGQSAEELRTAGGGIQAGENDSRRSSK